MSQVLQPLQAQDESKHPGPAVIALDPGVRTFMTGYDPRGKLVEWGRGNMTHIHNLCRLIDRLESLSTKTTHRQRCNWRRRILRWHERIRNKIDAMHKKLAKWLCENYCLVLMPKFETSQMISKKMRKISSKTARAMCTWAHYRFRMRLKAKAREYPWCHVVDANEAFTSKTCGHCGTVNNKLGVSKRFWCLSCGHEGDRDAEAARKILLRWLTNPSVVEGQAN